MIAIILSWILLSLVFLSFGEMAVSAWNRITKRKNSYSAIDKFWIGICSVGSVLLYISMIFPLDIWILGGLLIISFGYWMIHLRTLNSYFKKIYWLISKFAFHEKLIFGLVIVAILIYSLSTPLIYDEGLYHLQTMQWCGSFPTVVGLGNLHGRLGFNSSFLLLSTVFNYQPEDFLTFFPINSLCLLVFSVWMIQQIGKSESVIKNAALGFILLVSLFSLGANAASTSTDILPHIFIMYILLNWVTKKDIAIEKPLMVAFMSIFCITLKLSSVIILLATLFSLVALWRKKEWRTISHIIGLGIVVAIPWLIRFVILTGYLVYPFPSIDLFSVDWKIPLEMVQYEKDIAYAWARIPNESEVIVLSMSFREWFPIWLKNLSFYNLGMYILASVSPIALLIGQRLSKNKNIIASWSIALIGLIFGMMTAPDFRFSFGFIICAGMLPFVAMPSCTILENRIVKRGLKLGIGLGIIGIIYVASSQVKAYQVLSEDTNQSLLYKPQAINLLQKKVNLTFEEKKLNYTTIFIPRETNQCFEQNIPCAPHYNSNLELRGRGIGNGFRIKK